MGVHHREAAFEPSTTPGRRRAVAAVQPIDLEALPPVGDHLVGGPVGIGRLGELLRQQAGSAGRQRLADALPMLEDRLRSLGVQHSLQLLPRRRLARMRARGTNPRRG